MNPSSTFQARKWDLSKYDWLVIDVRGLITYSLHARANPASPNAWGSTLTVRWSNRADGTGARDFGSAQTLTSAGPGIPSLDVSNIAYLVIAPPDGPLTQQYIDIDGIGKSDP
jgi:hypothetical protein